jgi:hypothetical protein
VPITIRYPAALDVFPARGNMQNDPPTQTDFLEAFKDAIEALERELSTNPRGNYASVKARLEAIQAGDLTSINMSKLVGGEITAGGLPSVNFVPSVTTNGAVVASGTVTGRYVQAGADSGHIPFRLQESAGTLNASGYAEVAHGVGFGEQRIFGVSAHFQGAGTEINAISGLTWDGATIYVQGGTGSGSRPFRVYWHYRETALAWP